MIHLIGMWLAAEFDERKQIAEETNRLLREQNELLRKTVPKESKADSWDKYKARSATPVHHSEFK